MFRHGKNVLVAISVIIVLSFLISPVFIMAEADHNCSGEDCHICHLVGMFMASLNKSSAMLWLVLFALAVLCPFVFYFNCNILYCSFNSLVNLKVKLSD